MFEKFLLAIAAAREIAGLIMNASIAIRRLDGRARDDAKEELKALQVTLDEWIEHARAAEPAMPPPPSDAHDRVQYILAQYDSVRNKIQKAPLTATTLPGYSQHSGVELSDSGEVYLVLGKSARTRSLRGRKSALEVRFPFATIKSAAPLPTFNITMLGGSGAGKTVYMSTMYTKLVNGVGSGSIALRATDPDVDLELRQTVESFLFDGKWPLGTVGDQRDYNFELLVHGIPVASVNWVDYRGGDITARYSDDPAAYDIRNRIRHSHAVLWMVDMTKIRAKNLASMAAKIQTSVGRYAALCRETTLDPKAWIFVRTKADTVTNGDDSADFPRAVRELREHLGDTATTVTNLGSFSRAVLVPVSSTGYVNEENVPEGEDPVNVEWPFLLALAALLEGELARLEHQGVSLRREYAEMKSVNTTAFFRRLFALGPSREEQAVWAGKCSALTRELLRVQDVIRTIMAEIPHDQIIFA